MDGISSSTMTKSDRYALFSVCIACLCIFSLYCWAVILLGGCASAPTTAWVVDSVTAGAVDCRVSLGDGGTRDYPACAGPGSDQVTVSWGGAHYCDLAALPDGGRAWQTDPNWSTCAAGQACAVVDVSAPKGTPDTFYGACR